MKQLLSSVKFILAKLTIIMKKKTPKNPTIWEQNKKLNEQRKLYAQWRSASLCYEMTPWYIPESEEEWKQHFSKIAQENEIYEEYLELNDRKLLKAFDSHDISALNDALKAGANPNLFTTWFGEPLAAYAARYNWPEAIDALLDAGADPMLDDGSLLITLCEHGPAHILQRVFQIPGISPMFQSGGDSLAVLAAEEGQVDCLRVLRSAGANLLDNEGKALCRACLENKVEVARYLIEECHANLEEEYDDHSPLFYAVRTNAMECAEFLLKHGASPIHKDIVGSTPLHYAKTEAMKQLLARYCS